MRCAEEHSCSHVPPGPLGPQGAFQMRCGSVVIDTLRMEPGMNRAAVDHWMRRVLRDHEARVPRPCLHERDAFCYGDTHGDCAALTAPAFLTVAR